MAFRKTHALEPTILDQQNLYSTQPQAPLFRPSVCSRLLSITPILTAHILRSISALTLNAHPLPPPLTPPSTSTLNVHFRGLSLVPTIGSVFAICPYAAGFTQAEPPSLQGQQTILNYSALWDHRL